jgi:hypothetical protein
VWDIYMYFSCETYTCTSRVRHIHVLLVWDIYMYFSCETYTCISRVKHIHVLLVWDIYMYFSCETYTCISRVKHIHVLLVWDIYMYFSCETYTCTFVFSDFRWEVVVNFVDIGGVEHHLINCLISGDCLTLLERRETYFHGENKLPLDEVKTSSALY